MEPKPAERYEVTPTVNALAQPGGNGKLSTPDGLATIDEQSRQAAMARAMIENEKREREQRCGAEISSAIEAICKRNRCKLSFMELRQDGGLNKMWIQPVAQDEQAT